MSEKISQGMAQLINQLHRENMERRAEIQALIKILKMALPHLTPEVQAELKKYGQYKKEIYEQEMIRLERINPALAASLDKDRPLLPPA